MRRGVLGWQRAQKFWPVWSVALFAAILIWAALRWTIGFYWWHRGFTAFLLLAVLVSLIAFWKIWPKPEAFSLRAQASLNRKARRFWLANLLIHLTLALAANAAVWGLLWLFGPRVGILALGAVTEALGLTGLLGALLLKIPATLALCWDFDSEQSPEPALEIAGGKSHFGAQVWAVARPRIDWFVWVLEFSLSQRHIQALRCDLQRGNPKSLAIVRALEQGERGNLIDDGETWRPARWRSAWLIRARAATWLGLAALPLLLLVLGIMLGGLRFTAFPPGYLQGDRLPMTLMAQSRMEDPVPPMQDAVDEAGSPAHGGGDQANSEDGAGDGGNEGAAEGSGTGMDAGKGESGQAGETSAGTEGDAGGASSGASGESGEAASDSQGQDDSGGPSDASPGRSQDRARQDKSGLDMPGMPGMQPGDQGSETGAEGLGGMKPMGLPGEGGKGEGMPSGQQAEGGDGIGQGEASPQDAQDGRQGDHQLDGKGSKEGPRNLEYGGGGGPQAGPPGPPSPPDPDVQDLVKIEVPPVEAGDLRRRSLDKEVRRGSRGARSVAERDAGPVNQDPLKVQREPDQPLPNWILLMLKKPSKEKRSESP